MIGRSGSVTKPVLESFITRAGAAELDAFVFTFLLVKAVQKKKKQNNNNMLLKVPVDVSVVMSESLNAARKVHLKWLCNIIL